MSDLTWTKDDRDALRSLVASEQFKVVRRVIDRLLESESSAYNNAVSEHRYLQGVLHGTNNVLVALHAFSTPEKEVEVEENREFMVTGMFGSPISSATDY